MAIPTVKIPARVYDGTLAWCNAIRKKKGMPPFKALPDGIQGSPFSCPCGKACGAIVQRAYFSFNDNARSFRKLPKVVQNFVAMFDDYELPKRFPILRPVRSKD